MEDHRHTGFTLAELLVTLAVLAILVGIAVPATTGYLRKARLQAASEALVQELQQARNHAITYRTAVYFSYALTTPDWCFGWSDNGPCDCRDDAVALRCASGDGDDLRIHRLSARDFPSIRIDSSRSASQSLLRYSPLRGTVTAASFILSNHRLQRKVIVSPLGRVRQCTPDRWHDAAC